ncbi:TetR/AcrR family transcriptional regulator [Amycolatopsis balhimycina DSM 5908]|uniref:TetR/AcrR family transcriptional regulator n=1 Tax=Amycolatopsis balhimycina DSM 5908 TaxID=1081091 RepID=A0A428X666_AMYBA|nr:TetR/AcrR family transcriptional regulator [Amycolatopsis balhimycina]RSM50824.1 TetR/AcrR family transcriptional regulator [Amycolatopsis balhimycina DSM 5908]
MGSSDAGEVVRSRRERPAKPALTRQGIIAAALAILNEEGLSKVTMRRIAAALDTGHASLYVYVRDVEDLHAQILDALLAPVVDAAPVAGTWRSRLKALMDGYGQVLVARPEIARMALSTQPSGPNYLALVEAILALLHEGGATDRAAAWGVDLLLLFPTASAVERTAPKPSKHATGDLAAMAAAIAAADPGRSPHIVRLGDELISGDGRSRFGWAVDVLLDGILAAGSRARTGQSR